MNRERALKVVLGLLFSAAVYPLMMMAKQDPSLAMMMSLSVGRALVEKPSGCVVWIGLNKDTLDLGLFMWVWRAAWLAVTRHLRLPKSQADNPQCEGPPSGTQESSCTAACGFHKAEDVG